MLHNDQLRDMLKPGVSPLDSAELANFRGLAHYTPNDTFHVTAKIHWLQTQSTFEMAHTGGDTRTYMRVAELYFNLAGTDYKLMAYQTEKMRTQRMFFIPFTDYTNGAETYGGGRYLEVNYAPNASEIDLDFNLSFYPYCAYSHRYSCPVVPEENRLNLMIRAGEKDKN